ncbi:hypothetical protein MNBD_GAMMA15-408 [hydrothermal vent metagenome]|uniref:Uncharacterized protein n=1 Tax=hydrothermal vent metagenome TaxID=652676 RepID=A0A3B0YBG8_9ZZZZ
MSKKVQLLPHATKTHLFKLITDSTYRKSADKSSYGYKPRGDGLMGRPCSPSQIKKFGYTSLLASGTATRHKKGGRDPGKLRIIRMIEDQRHTWWIADHTPSNLYRFHKIVGIPKCATCKGTAEQICPKCSGSASLSETSGRTNNFVRTSRCVTCAGKGWRKCPDCNRNVLVEGHTVSSNFNKW